MPYTFKPPTLEVSADPHMIERSGFVHRLAYRRGYSVVVDGATVTDYPGKQGLTHSEIENYTTYQGGRRYTITDAEYAVLIAADAQWGDHCEAL